MNTSLPIPIYYVIWQPLRFQDVSMRYPVMAESEFKMSKAPMDGHAIVGLPGTESCFLNQVCTTNTQRWLRVFPQTPKTWLLEFPCFDILCLQDFVQVTIYFNFFAGCWLPNQRLGIRGGCSCPSDVAISLRQNVWPDQRTGKPFQYRSFDISNQHISTLFFMGSMSDTLNNWYE